MLKTSWGIDSVLKALHNLFSESPAKREDFIKLTGTETFHLPFCGQRWLENKQVAERALEIWPHITTYIRETLKKPKSQVQTSNTFKTVNSAVQGPLLRAKLAFFASTAGLMQPYLQIFQSDAPLLPFVTSDLQGLLETLMSKFVKQGELEKAGTAFKLVKLDVTQPSAQVAPQDADVEFAAKASLEKLLKEKKISDLQAFEFKKDCITMLASTVAKIQERSPLKYSLARNLVCLDPWKMVSTLEEDVKMFQAVLQKLIHSGWKISSQGDSILSQFRRFVSDARKHHQEQFSLYKHNYTRLDSLCDTLSKDEKFKELWSTLQILLTLSHSQAAVERGFSVNKEVLAPNMQEMNLKAIRLVHSSGVSLKIKISDFTVTDKLLKSCPPASNKYKMYLIEKKAEKEKTDMGQKRKALQDELMAAKKKKTELESIASWLLDTANKKAKEAEKKSGVATMKALIMESNAS